MYLKSHLKSPQPISKSPEKTVSLPSIPSWPPNPTTTSDPLLTFNLTQTLPNPITPQTRPLAPAILITLFFILLMTAFCVMMLLFFLLPRAVDYWEGWLGWRSSGDWSRGRRGGGRRIVYKRKNVCGAGAKVLEYGGCVFEGKAGCGFLARQREGDLDLERGGCCENGDKEREGYRGKRCRGGKIVRFVEEVEVVEFGNGDIVMLVGGMRRGRGLLG